MMETPTSIRPQPSFSVSPEESHCGNGRLAAAKNFAVKGFIETSFSDWPGKVAAVLFLPSCNLRCRYCHNYELVLQPEKFPVYPFAVILEKLRKYQGWIDGVCITGGEPTLHPWLPALCAELKNTKGLASPGESMRIKLDTNGTQPELLKNLMAAGLLDYVAMDIKAPLDFARYAAVTGELKATEWSLIQSSIDLLMEGRVDFEFRTTLVPGLIDEEEVYDLARKISGAPRYTLQNFRPQEALDPAYREIRPWDDSVLRRMQTGVNEIISGRNGETAKSRPGERRPALCEDGL